MISAVKRAELPASVAGDGVPATPDPSFFEIVRHCHELDERYSSIFSKRRTRIYIIDDRRKLRACIRVSHIENGGIWGQCADIFEEDDIIMEIDSLHRVINDRIRCSKVIDHDLDVGELP